MLIYIADDEKSIRDIIDTFLTNNGYQVRTFEKGDDLQDAFLQKPSDMVILDILMPGMDGLTLCQNIRKRSNVPIIFVSAKDSEMDRITGIAMGADDYLVKPFAPMELVVRVQSIFRRIAFCETTQPKEVLQFGDIVLNPSLKTATAQDQKLDLTPTEFILMTYLFTHQERAISREELLKNVWKFEGHVDTKACDDVLKRLRKKLIHTKVKISAVWGFGFKLEEVTDDNH